MFGREGVNVDGCVIKEEVNMVSFVWYRVEYVGIDVYSIYYWWINCKW